MAKKETSLIRSEFDRFFNEPGWPGLQWPAFRFRQGVDEGWNPGVDVFEKDNRLFTRVDLPGLKKEEIKVEVAEGHLVISGERKREEEEKGEQFYRCEREYGTFYRTVPLPDGVRVEDINAVFAEGVLEVSVPLMTPKAEVKSVEVKEPAKATKAAA